MTGLRYDSNAALIFMPTHAFVLCFTLAQHATLHFTTQTHTHSPTANTMKIPKCFEQLEDTLATLTLPLSISINTET